MLPIRDQAIRSQSNGRTAISGVLRATTIARVTRMRWWPVKKRSSG